MIEPPLLDAEHLAEIEALEAFRPGLREQMLALFTGSTRVSMNVCDTAWKAGDRNNLSQAAHRLVGSAASLGATRLRSLAGKLEQQALDKRDPPIYTAQLEELDATLEETISAFQAWLEE